MVRKFYTIDDLYKFCKHNKFESYSAKETGAPLIIQSLGDFEINESETEGLLSVKLKSCHTGKNRNQSGISDEVMETYKNSFKGRPILGAIYKTDTGEYEFRGHDMKLVEGEDGAEVEYIEQPVGVISQTEEPYLEYDEEADKNYLMVSGTIFAEYSRAAEILQRRKTCRCSVEIAVEEFSYNCAEDYLSIDKFRFSAVTILGYQQDGTTEVLEGMEGSRITIGDFSEANNSFCTNAKAVNEIVKEGGEIKMEDEKIVEEAIETVEEEVAEVEEVIETEEIVEVEEVEDTEEIEVVEELTTEEPVVESGRFSVNENGDTIVSFEISHEDLRCALYQLLAPVEETDEDYYYIESVFDDNFIYSGWRSGKLYRQKYTKDEESVSLGDREEVFRIIVTAAEKDALEALKSNYESVMTERNELKAYKDECEAKAIKAQKDAIFAKTEYSVLADSEEFAALIADADNYSVEECENKADLIFAKYMKANLNFAKEVESTPSVVAFAAKEDKVEEPRPYGNLFAK